MSLQGKAPRLPKDRRPSTCRSPDVKPGSILAGSRPGPRSSLLQPRLFPVTALLVHAGVPLLPPPKAWGWEDWLGPVGGPVRPSRTPGVGPAPGAPQSQRWGARSQRHRPPPEPGRGETEPTSRQEEEPQSLSGGRVRPGTGALERAATPRTPPGAQRRGKGGAAPGLGSQTTSTWRPK